MRHIPDVSSNTNDRNAKFVDEKAKDRGRSAKAAQIETVFLLQFLIAEVEYQGCLAATGWPDAILAAILVAIRDATRDTIPDAIPDTTLCAIPNTIQDAIPDAILAP